MAITYLKAVSATLPNASNTITVTGENVDFSKVNDYLVAIDNGLYVLPILSGTAPDVNGDSTITLVDTWTGVTLTSKGLMVFPTFAKIYESVAAMTALNDITRGILLKLNNLLTDTTATLPIVVGQTTTITTTPYGYLANQVTTLINQLNSNIGSVLAITKAEFDALAEKRIRDNAGSGYLEIGKHHDATSLPKVNDGIWTQPTAVNFFNMGRSVSAFAGSSLSDYPIELVNGVEIHLTKVKDSSADENTILLPPAPDGLDKSDGTGRFATLAAAITAGTTALNASVITRQDLVLFEVWHEKISDKDVVYPLGNVQYGVSTWNAITLSNTVEVQGYSAFGDWDTVTKGYGVVWSTLAAANKTEFIQDPKNNIYSDDGLLVQVRYRVRVIKGLGDSWNNIDPNAPSVFTGYSYLEYSGVNRIQSRGSLTSNVDYGSGTDSSYLNARTIASLGSTNESGVFGLKTKGTTTSAHNGLCFAIPIALVQRRNKGAWHPVYNPEGCATWRNPTSGGVFYWYNNSRTDINSRSVAFDTAKIGYAGGSTTAAATSWLGAIGGTPYRSDGKFYDAVYAEDIQDLRNSARRKTPHELLKYAQKAIAGELRGFESVPFTRAVSVNVTGGSSFTTFRTIVCGILPANVRGMNVGGVIANDASWLTCGYFQDSGGTLHKVVSTSADGLSFVQSRIPETGVVVAGIGTLIVMEMDYPNVVRSTHKSESPTWTDIIGSPANILATFPNGVEGQWIPDFSNIVSDKALNRPNTSSSVSHTITSNNGVSWVNIPSVTTTGTTNAVSFNVGPTETALWSYPVMAKFLETANNSVVLEIGDVFSSQYVGKAQGSELVYNTIGKVATGTSYLNNTGFVHKKLTDWNIESFPNASQGKFEYSKPAHDPITTFASAKPTSKMAFYITRENSQFYLQVMYKEMIFDTVSSTWGDDSKFDIFNGESTVTDSNAKSVVAGQKRIKLPFFTGEA